MVEQRRAESQGASSFFADGRVMQAPPRHTVAASARLDARTQLEGRDDARNDGRDDGIARGQYLSKPPVALDRASLARGREHFERFCAPCHGLLGDGVSVVAQHMQLRKPPALIAEPGRSLPAGRVFQVIGNGYGLMPSYAQELDVAQRWGVVGYLQALVLSQAAPLAALPEAVRHAAMEKLR
jgi:mono/diheme cytochrome c family protein